MHHLRALAVAAIAHNATDHVRSTLPLSHSSMVYASLPSIYATVHGSSAKLSEEVSAFTTKTVIDRVIKTQVVTLVNTSRTPETRDPDPYSFIVRAGKTTWLDDKTPPASILFEVKTSYVALQPEAVTTVPSFLPSVATAIAFPSNKYTGNGEAGWNASTFAKVLTAPSHIAKHRGSRKTDDTLPSFNQSSYAAGCPTAKNRRHLVARDVDDVVVATIDDAVVSWTNNFDGATSSAEELLNQSPNSVLVPSSLTFTTVVSSEISIMTPSATVAIYPWDLSLPNGLAPSTSTTSTVATSRLSGKGFAIPITVESAIPTIPLGVGLYPWDLGSESSTSIISSTSTKFHPSFKYSNIPNTTIEKPSSCSSTSPYFTVTFDDLPHFDISSDSDNIDTPPILNPYRKLYWDSHFGYVPPPSDPYSPHSPPQLAVYRATTSPNTTTSPDASLELAGEIGSSPHRSDSAFRLNAHSMYFGCSDGSSSPCELIINGYAAKSNNTDVSTRRQSVEIPPCPGLTGCSLSLVIFASDMIGLSGVQLLASVKGKTVDYYVDDVVLSWVDDTCAAQWERASVE